MANALGDNQRGRSGYLHSRLKNAFHNSNNLITGFSSNISSRLSMFSVGASSSQEASPTLPVDLDYEPELPLHKLPGTPDSITFSYSEKKSPTVKEKIRETFKFENIRPALEDLMLSDESSEPSTLPTNTPESPKSGFHFKLSAINQSIPKKFGDYKALAMRTLSGEGSENVEKVVAPCVNVECVDQTVKTPAKDVKKPEEKLEPRDIENASTCFSSRSLPSLQSLQANGPDPYDKFKFKPDISSGSASETGVGHSASLDSSDSDPHKKLWVRSGSQSSLQSWASSLSYDSQFEEVNEVREFMRSFVDDIFKNPHLSTVSRKAEFGKLAQSEQGRLWFARCINAKRGCKFVSEATFFSLIQHFAVMLFECSEADDFSPAKSLMNMCFTYYHEVTSPGGNNRRKEFIYLYLRQQPIWRSLRFWNAAFFDALQCERFMRPVATREQVDGSGANSQETLQDELHYQENITFGQLGTFTCNMHAFGLPKEMVNEFLRKQVTIGSLRSDQVKLLKENVDRMYSHKQEWQ